MGQSPEARFWENVDKSGDCWLWRGYLKPNGYGTFYPGGGRGAPKVYAHRYAYELVVGPIPEGAEIDHTCNVRCCVNPAHMEPVSHRTNLDRAVERRTQCKHGHTLADAYRIAGNRVCRTCRIEASRRTRAKVRA